MPIPDFSLIAPPEFITAAEAVEMVMERFKSSGCTEDEACAWLSEQVRIGKLKLLWTDREPTYLTGLILAGENFAFIPSLPGTRVLDELDWRTGELRRRLRIPQSIYREARGIDPSKLTFDEVLARDRELLARYGCDIFDVREPREWVIEELNYRFALTHASLVAILTEAAPAPAEQTAGVAGLSQNADERRAATLSVKRPDPRSKREE
jgi:hypothetical protein